MREAASDATGLVNASQQHLKDKKVSSCHLGRFAMEMCRSGRSSAADLSALCRQAPRRNPRCAALLPQWTSKRACDKGSANNTTNTLPGRLSQGVGQAVQRSVLVRRKHPKWSEVENCQTSSSVVSFLLLHEMLQHPVPGRLASGLREPST